jgi:long-chain fatty acid transport protein
MRRIVSTAFALAAATLVAVVATPRTLHAGGFEIAEQSPAGVATVGAQGAVAADPSTVYYNPAGMTFQPGLGALVGGNLGIVDTRVDANGRTSPTHVALGPTVYAVQRLGKRFAVGIGGFANFAEHFDYPNEWVGRYAGQYVDLTTYTFNPNVAFRPIERLSIAVGLMVTPASVQLKQAVNFGGADAQFDLGGTAWGVGGNAALLVDIIPKYLRFGYSYRSRMDLNFTGDAALNFVPPELAAQAPQLSRGAATLILPHNMSFSLASSPIPMLTISADIRYTLWSQAQQITINLTDVNGAPLPDRVLPLNLRDSVGVRVGGEYRFWSGKLPVRLGVGWDNTPVPPSTLSPLFPDTDRVLVAGGVGYHGKWWAVEGGYLAAILLKEQATNPSFTATYSNVVHVVSAAVTLRFASLGGDRFSANRPGASPVEAGPLRATTW